MQVITARRLWIHDRQFVAVRMALTAPARVTGSFVGPGGVTVPGQTVKTPTRRAGITILRMPMHVTKAGTYVLHMHADGAGQTTDRTVTIHFSMQRPTSPLWQTVRPLTVVVIHGANVGPSRLAGGLGHGYRIDALADAALYTALDPISETAGAAVVVDLATVPMKSLSGLHALLPEVKIIGLTNSKALAKRARWLGVSAVLGKSASAAQVAATVKSLLHPQR
jgi:hypothetical protein